jgi:hypothetical protein
MASGHMNRVKRPDTWLHRPRLQNVKKVLANPEPSTHDPLAGIMSQFEFLFFFARSTTEISRIVAFAWLRSGRASLQWRQAQPSPQPHGGRTRMLAGRRCKGRIVTVSLRNSGTNAAALRSAAVSQPSPGPTWKHLGF